MGARGVRGWPSVFFTLTLAPSVFIVVSVNEHEEEHGRVLHPQEILANWGIPRGPGSNVLDPGWMPLFIGQRTAPRHPRKMNHFLWEKLTVGHKRAVGRWTVEGSATVLSA